MPRIGGGCPDKNRFKKAKNPVRVVLSRAPFNSGSEISPIKIEIRTLFTSKAQIRILLSVLRYGLPRFSGIGQSQRVATF